MNKTKAIVRNISLTIGIVFLANINSLSSFASELYPDNEGIKQTHSNDSGPITIHVMNTVPCVDHNKIKEKLNFPSIPESFYALYNEGDTAFHYITNLQVMLTLVYKNLNSQVYYEPLSREEKITSFEIPALARKNLDKIYLQILGVSFPMLDLKNNVVVPIEDNRPVSLGSVWHCVRPGTKGWLYKDALYTVFQKSSDVTQKHPYHLYLTSPYALAKPAKL